MAHLHFEYLIRLSFLRLRTRSCLSRLDIETCTTATAAGSGWVSHNLELASNQFHGKVNLATL